MITHYYEHKAVFVKCWIKKNNKTMKNKTKQNKKQQKKPNKAKQKTCLSVHIDLSRLAPLFQCFLFVKMF